MTEEKKTAKQKSSTSKKSDTAEKSTNKTVTVKTEKTSVKEAIQTIEDKKKKGEPMHNLFSGKYHYANGKRKNAVARVRVYEEGNNDIVVNGKPYQEYFKVGTLFGLILSPLKMSNLQSYSITAKIVGGGVSAQADALRHGIAKALTLLNQSNRTLLKKSGQLTRDDRTVERKKYGRRKARRGQQWVKR